ncbi:VanZ family protein [Undibacterium arcticum]|uniref:VanZ family protein n=1 Tax=Undibacterium arcticum TaxID=1762892 RepID=A0ABV7F191_9BURK
MIAAAPPPTSPSASPFARAALMAYLLLIVYASWYPFTGWQDIGVSPFAFLTAPFPRYWTLFDVWTNVVGYVPFGALAVLALYPLLRGAAAWLLASLAGVLVSGGMEAVQTFLPNRVSSNVDFYTNATGACIGALLGLLLTPPLLQRGRLRLLRQRWFAPEASRGLIVIALWPLAQIYPQAFLFGHGQLLPILSDWLSSWLSMPIDLGDLLRHGAELTVEQYWLSETIITACGLTGAVLTLLSLLNREAPKLPLALLVLVAALTVKSLACALLFAPDNAFVWLTPAAFGGILIGALMLAGLLFTRPYAQRRLAIVTLLISLAVLNAIPANPYFIATLQTWVQGKFLNFNGAAQFLSLLWPFSALWFLFRRSAEAKPGARYH